VEFTRPQGLSTPNDAGGNSFNAGATSYTVSTSAATTNANDFVIDCFASAALGNNQFTLTGGFTSAFSSVDAFGQMRCGYLVTSSTGTQTGTATVTTSMRGTGIIMAFKPWSGFTSPVLWFRPRTLAVLFHVLGIDLIRYIETPGDVSNCGNGNDGNGES
jgi:hypothetical protein